MKLFIILGIFIVLSCGLVLAINEQYRGNYSYHQLDSNFRDILSRDSSSVYGNVKINGTKILGNGSAYFDGVGDAFNYNVSGATFITKEFTVRLWVNAVTQVVGCKYTQVKLFQYVYPARISTIGIKCDTGKPFTEITSSSYQTFNADTAVTDGAWHHIVILGNASSNVYMFIDGVEQTGKATMNANESWTTGNIRVGSSIEDLQEFQGHLDEIIWVGRAWNKTEIAQDYNSGIGSSYPTATDTSPPTISNAICTSCYAKNYSSDATPTINVTCTDNTATCSMVRLANDSSLSYTTMTLSRNCTAGSGDTYICTLPSTDAIPNGGMVYFTATDGTNSHSVYNLSINISRPRFLVGNVTDSSLHLVKNATIFVTGNNSNNIVYNASSGDTGIWNMTVLPGVYTICAYKPTNSTLRGDCLPFIEVT